METGTGGLWSHLRALSVCCVAPRLGRPAHGRARCAGDDLGTAYIGVCGGAAELARSGLENGSV